LPENSTFTELLKNLADSVNILTDEILKRETKNNINKLVDEMKPKITAIIKAKSKEEFEEARQNALDLLKEKEKTISKNAGIRSELRAALLNYNPIDVHNFAKRAAIAETKARITEFSNRIYNGETGKEAYVNTFKNLDDVSPEIERTKDNKGNITSRLKPVAVRVTKKTEQNKKNPKETATTPIKADKSKAKASKTATTPTNNSKETTKKTTAKNARAKEMAKEFQEKASEKNNENTSKLNDKPQKAKYAMGNATYDQLAPIVAKLGKAKKEFVRLK